MQTLLVDLYAELLADYGVDLTQGISAQDGAFFDDVVNAMGSLSSYGIPACIQLGSLQHIQSTGLQIARTPGKKLVDNVTGRWVYVSNTG
jgi:cytochrome c biogenesis protein